MDPSWDFLLKTGDFPGIRHLRKFQGGALPSPHGKTGGFPRISNKNLALKYKRLKMLGPMGPLISCLVGTAPWKPQKSYTETLVEGRFWLLQFCCFEVKPSITREVWRWYVPVVEIPKYICVCLFVCLFCLFCFVLFCLFGFLFVCLSVCLSVCLFVCLFKPGTSFLSCCLCSALCQQFQFTWHRGHDLGFSNVHRDLPCEVCHLAFGIAVRHDGSFGEVKKHDDWRQVASELT